MSQPFKLSSMLILPFADSKHKTTSHGDFICIYVLGLLFANTAAVKMLPGTCNVRSFLPYTDSSNNLCNLCLNKLAYLHGHQG